MKRNNLDRPLYSWLYVTALVDLLTRYTASDSMVVIECANASVNKSRHAPDGSLSI